MFYYIDTIEQVEAEEESEWDVNEYGARTQYKGETFEQVQSRYFKKLSDVSNDLKDIDPSKKHYYMNIKISDTTGGVLEQKSIGTMQEVHKKEQPEPTPEIEEG